MTGRLLVVNADDFGLTPGVCAGVLQAHEQGIVTSTSVLTPAPAFDAHAAALRDSGLAVGLHLCAVGEDPPLLSQREVPSLVDGAGRLPPTWKVFCTRAAAGRIDPADLEREFGAQAEAARVAGLRLGHIDAHQNLQLWPEVARVAIDLATSHRIPVLRVTATTRWGPTALGVRGLGALVRRRARRAGLAVPDHAAGLDTAGHLGGARLRALITGLSGGTGSVDIAVHPGADPDPARDRYRWGYEWADELAALCHPDTAASVRRAGFRLGTFAELPRAGGAAA